MQYAAICWLAVSVGQSPCPEYTGPAYTQYDGKARPVGVRLAGVAIDGCVRAGVGPRTLARLFGPPLLVERDNKGPYRWWYPDLGVTVSFPARAFDRGKANVQGPGTYERLNGAIGP